MSSQREAYQLPAQREGTAGGSGNGTTTNNNQAALAGYSSGYGAGEGSGGAVVQYVCGECATKVSLGRGDAIRCSMCGHRVLYKERTKRMVQFEAR